MEVRATDLSKAFFWYVAFTFVSPSIVLMLACACFSVRLLYCPLNLSIAVRMRLCAFVQLPFERPTVSSVCCTRVRITNF